MSEINKDNIAEIANEQFPSYDSYSADERMDKLNVYVEAALNPITDEMFNDADVNRVADHIEPEDLMFLPDNYNAYNVYFKPDTDIIDKLCARALPNTDSYVITSAGVYSDDNLYALVDLTNDDVRLYLEMDDGNVYKEFRVPITAAEADTVKSNVERIMEQREAGNKNKDIHERD